MARDLFISHAKEDTAAAFEIAGGLERAGYCTWYYERDSKPGPSYILQTGKAIEQSQAFILLISQSSIQSRQLTKEVVRAHETGKPIRARERKPRSRMRDFHNWLARRKSALKKYAAQGKVEYLAQEVFTLVFGFLHPAFCNTIFTGTTLEARAKLTSKRSQAVILTSSGKYPRAKETYETLLRDFPEDAKALNSYTWLSLDEPLQGAPRLC